MGDVTVAELEALRQAEPELVTYKAVGKMYAMCLQLEVVYRFSSYKLHPAHSRFLMEDPKAITTDLAAKSEKFKREVNVLIKTKDYLETAVKEQENAIRELFVTRRA